MRFCDEVLVDAPLAATWEVLADISTHVEWMADAESIAFTTPQRRGAGTAFDCKTRVGPLTTIDQMTVTEWIEESKMAVAHTGIVRGVGVFELAAVGPELTRVNWNEDLRFPLWGGGVIGAFAAKPVLRRIWRGNLSRLKALVEASYRSNRY
ncbi:MAG TPA: SRPBCC family protein [Acidimicrobiales bacterium]|nr:SRPBCC family protein [Acidimicrobiales bacterium]